MAKEKLRQLQQQWVQLQQNERETYQISPASNGVPSEETLKLLVECRESGNKTTCFQEGYCSFQGSRLCTYNKS